MGFLPKHVLAVLAAFTTLLPGILLLTAPATGRWPTASLSAVPAPSDDAGAPCGEVVEEEREEETETKVHLFVGGVTGMHPVDLTAWATDCGGRVPWPHAYRGAPAIRGPPSA